MASFPVRRRPGSSEPRPAESGLLGVCATCHARVPAEFVVRGRRVLLRKRCPTCGAGESLVSTNAAAWLDKRSTLEYLPAPRGVCTLECDRCKRSHRPTIVFIDVTNRCNMNCPICIATIRRMGFPYDPPLAYFEKVFAALSTFDPLPMVELFGGEPTVREDLLEIIDAGRRHGLKARVVTNGLRLADEDYARALCQAGVRFRFSLDGRRPEIYRRLRNNPGACEKKLRALANLARYSRRKHALLACVARGINDDDVADLIRCCHEHRGLLGELGLIPLTENWRPGEFQAPEPTTSEDVEAIVERSVPGGDVSFLPAGAIEVLRPARSFFRRSSCSEMLMFGGVHPNCESMALLVSDGRRYTSVHRYLRMPLRVLAKELLARGRPLNRRLRKLDPSRPIRRLLGRLLVLATYVPLALRAVDWRACCRTRPGADLARLVLELVRGRRFRDAARKHLVAQYVLRVAVLPFEEYDAIDSDRLRNCKAAFAYEDTQDGQVKTIPACIWYPYRDALLRKITGKYGTAGGATAP